MATIAPYIPESITVHLGSPDSNAENVTVSFSDYVKNVLSSEVYPTWEPAALRANALAIISFALNRIYTEYYRSEMQLKRPVLQQPGVFLRYHVLDGH